MWNKSQPPPLSTRTFSGQWGYLHSVVPSPKWSRDRKKKKFTEFLQSRRKCNLECGDKQTPCCVGPVPVLLAAAATSRRLSLLSDVRSNSYRLPPAVQSVPLQWSLHLRAVLFVVLLGKTGRPSPVANLWPSMGVLLGPRNPVEFCFSCFFIASFNSDGF